jgi:hypothetical protein
VAITLIGLLAVAAMVSSVTLIVDLIRGSKVTESATSLLASGALIWLGNALVFGLLYWELDSGGHSLVTGDSARTLTSRFRSN